MPRIGFVDNLNGSETPDDWKSIHERSFGVAKIEAMISPRLRRPHLEVGLATLRISPVRSVTTNHNAAH